MEQQLQELQRLQQKLEAIISSTPVIRDPSVDLTLVGSFSFGGGLGTIDFLGTDIYRTRTSTIYVHTSGGVAGVSVWRGAILFDAPLFDEFFRRLWELKK